MTPLLRKLAFFTVSMFCLAALTSSLMSPRGVPMMLEKYREMQAMDEEIRLLRERVDRKRAEVERLRVSDEERRRAVRQHLNKALPGETVILLPDGQKEQSAAQPDASGGARQ